MEYNFKDCLYYIKHKLKIHLYPYQELILKAFCEGKEVRTSRCIGRTYVAEAFGKYVANLYSSNNYSKNPDVVFPYDCALKNGLITQNFINQMQNKLSSETFNREFLCK